MSYKKQRQILTNLIATIAKTVKILKKSAIKDHLQDIDQLLNKTGEDGLTLVKRAQRPPYAVILGTSSAGKTELLANIFPAIRKFVKSTPANTTPIVSRLHYPSANNVDFAWVSHISIYDLVKLLSYLSLIRELCLDDEFFKLWKQIEISSSYDQEKTYKLLHAFFNKAICLFKDDEEIEFLKLWLPIIERCHATAGFTLEKKQWNSFLDYPKAGNEILHCCGMMANFPVKEKAFKVAEVYDTPGVRVGGCDGEPRYPSGLVHYQLLHYKSKTWVQRLFPHADAVIVVFVIEEQWVETEFKYLVERFCEYDHMQKRLFILLNKVDKVISFKQEKLKENNEEHTWKQWVFGNIIDRLPTLRKDFCNIFLCRSTNFEIPLEGKELLLKGKNSSTLNRYLYDTQKNIEACNDDNDGGILFTWDKIQNTMLQQSCQRLKEQILPVAEKLLHLLASHQIDISSEEIEKIQHSYDLLKSNNTF